LGTPKGHQRSGPMSPTEDSTLVEWTCSFVTRHSAVGDLLLIPNGLTRSQVEAARSGADTGWNGAGAVGKSAFGHNGPGRAGHSSARDPDHGRPEFPRGPRISRQLQHPKIRVPDSDRAKDGPSHRH